MGDNFQEQNPYCKYTVSLLVERHAFNDNTFDTNLILPICWLYGLKDCALPWFKRTIKTFPDEARTRQQKYTNKENHESHKFAQLAHCAK